MARVGGVEPCHDMLRVPPTQPYVSEENDENVGEDKNDEELVNEEPSEEKPVCNSGRRLIGRWGRGKRQQGCGEPPEVVVLQAPLHSRPVKPTSLSQPQQSAKRSRPKTSKKSDKKFIKQPFKIELDDESDIIRDDGRLIASKVLPIMAMLLQERDYKEVEDDDKPTEDETKKSAQPKLSVQCIQLLPSEPTCSRKH